MERVPSMKAEQNDMYKTTEFGYDYEGLFHFYIENNKI
jgi:hypothetical protein